MAGAGARVLGVNYEPGKQWRDDRKAYNGWRRAIEGTGVLVFQAVGVGVREMRGFSIAEETLPVIAVNRKDRVHGRIFSLLHEFIHLLLTNRGFAISMKMRCVLLRKAVSRFSATTPRSCPCAGAIGPAARADRRGKGRGQPSSME